MGDAPDNSVARRATLVAAERAFAELWPALAQSWVGATVEQRFEALVARLVLELVGLAAAERGLPLDALRGSKLARLSAPTSELTPLECLASLGPYRSASEGRVSEVDIGAVYEALLARRPLEHGGDERLPTRKRSGSYYTPPALAEQVVAAAFGEVAGKAPVLELRVLDPAVGAGVFLVQACRWLSRKLCEQEVGLSEKEARSLVASHCLYGVDISRLSVAVAELCLWLAAADEKRAPEQVALHLRHGDTLIGCGFEDEAVRATSAERLAELTAAGHAQHALDFGAEFPELARGFDVVLGNPPWVSFAGRSAQSLPAKVRGYFAERYAAWKGFPTLHGLFVERAAELAPRGTLALLIPSPVADLNGYRHVRSTLTRSHRIRSQLVEFGQDAFSGVTQPCFALLADAAADAEASAERWRLSERQRVAGAAEYVSIPEALALIHCAPTLDAAHFGEMGFQTTRLASETLLLRAAVPDASHQVALLEGRNVSEFSEGAPRLFLCADPERLKHVGCRLRGPQDYARVDFVVRQTASVPIAALHGGLAFRNSLLAGFSSEDLSAGLLVALLNSSLYRALHLAGQRDARQAAFPQVKVAHLRALPRPPRHPQHWRSLHDLTLEVTESGVTSESRARLDELVFDLFELPEDHRISILRFLLSRAPRHAPSQGLPHTSPTSPLDPVRRVLGLHSEETA